MKHNQQFNYVFKAILGYLNEREEVGAEWLSILDFDPNFFVTTPELITERQLFVLSKHVIELLELPELGLLLGERYNVLQIGVIGFTQYTAPTIRHASVIVKTYEKIISSHVNVSHLFSRNLVTFRFEFSKELGELRRLFVEWELVGYIQAIKELTKDSTILPVAVRFDFPSPIYADKYHELLQCPVSFDAEFIEISYDVNIFERPIPTSDPAAHRMMLGLCKRLLSKLESEADLVAQCREIIRDKIESNPSIDVVARELGVSKRTLSRRLNIKGMNFKSLVVDTRIHLACHYIKTTSLSLQKTSELCGFTSNSSFSHLFKRKFGIRLFTLFRKNRYGSCT